jgi:hypothetical protein
MQLLKTLFKNNNTTAVAAPVKEEATTPLTTVTPGEWFTSKEHYLEFRAAFKKYASDKNNKYGLRPVHFIIYAILRNRDWRDGWTIPEHPGKKIENRAKLSEAFNAIKSPWSEEHVLKPFDGTITTEMLIALRENLDEYRK